MRVGTRSPRSSSGGPATTGTHPTPDLRDDASTVGGPVYEWRECPVHPWYGVSVQVTEAGAMCVPPLDGAPNHSVAA